MYKYRYHWRQLIRGLSFNEKIIRAEVLDSFPMNDENYEGYLISNISMTTLSSTIKYLSLLAIVNRTMRKPHLWVIHEYREGASFLTVEGGWINYSERINQSQDYQQHQEKFVSAAFALLEKCNVMFGTSIDPHLEWRKIVNGLSGAGRWIQRASISKILEIDTQSRGYFIRNIMLPPGSQLQYIYILAVVNAFTATPQMWITVEESEGDPFLCLENSASRFNFGQVEDIRNEERFLRVAINLARSGKY